MKMMMINVLPLQHTGTNTACFLYGEAHLGRTVSDPNSGGGKHRIVWSKYPWQIPIINNK